MSNLFAIEKEKFLHLRPCNEKQKRRDMLIIPIKEGENIERALKKFKKKFEKTGGMKEVRARQHYTKPSVARREQLKKAIYSNQMKQEE
jgi:small subunit ribosomal protein S21